jgi:hypothetical protein
MSVFITVLRWLARLLGLVVACGFVALTLGDLLNPYSGGPSTLQEWAGIALLTATCAGMILACRWELEGAALSLTSLVVFTLIIRMGHHTVLFVLATPGILFFADWLLRRRHASTPA